MYSLEQRLKAIELYIKYGFYAAAVIRELGYPSETRTLKSWCQKLYKRGEELDINIDRIKF